ncbi:Trm112 family protein [Propionibacteriaceae bacterium Y1923]|uniref:Trm112 family protein n=1 Tax=Aestuariimicrobium sp. Y1814 TaxID=3418742 RepID=UPI003C257D8C
MSNPNHTPDLQLSPEFLEIAACPACHSRFAVDYDNREMVCANSQCGLAYPVRDGIPILLIDEARNTRAATQS